MKASSKWFTGIKVFMISLVYIILLVLILASIAIIRAHKQDDGRPELPQLFGVSFMVAPDDSMAGTKEGCFKKNDLLIVKIIESKNRPQFEKDDVVIYFDYAKGNYNASRIENINNFLVTVKGDNDSRLRNLSSNEVLALYQGKIKGVGSIINLLESTWGFILLIIVPISSLLIYHGVSIVKTVKEMKQEKDSEVFDEA
ncbi:MAG: hypothetical protein ACOX40_00605 [Bacilli bacterium]|jgi:hypothetical protein